MQYDEDDLGVEDEVFALNGVDSSSEDDNGKDAPEGMEIDEAPSTSRPSTGFKAKATKTLKRSATFSDSDTDEDDTEGEETWGAKKSVYYSANDAHFDSEDEEANELEEKEARRLQMKAREGMEDKDFGLDNLQALAQDGRMEPDVTEYVSLLFFRAPRDTSITPIEASWAILWLFHHFPRIRHPFCDILRKIAPKPWLWLAIGMILQ
jgi:U3 small nucleolar RNA-associated protein 3